jgi:nucleotide-binding universal stress UspA family protein
LSNTIVCGIDRSQGGDRAAAVAARLARDLDSAVVLANVAQPAGVSTGESVTSVPRARALGRLGALIQRQEFPRGASISLTTGEPAEELLEVARAHDAELLVVGSSGRREIGAALLGSVAGAIMRTAPCPVVIVPPRTSVPLEADEPRVVVCGVEGSDRDREVLPLAADLAARSGSMLHAVHAFDPGRLSPGAGGIAPPLLPDLCEAAEARLERALAESGVSARRGTVALPPAEALARTAERTRAHLIVTGCRGRGKLGSVLHGSVTIQLAARAPAPLVVLPPGARLSDGSGHYELRAYTA